MYWKRAAILFRCIEALIAEADVRGGILCIMNRDRHPRRRESVKLEEKLTADKLIFSMSYLSGNEFHRQDTGTRGRTGVHPWTGMTVSVSG